MILLFLFAIAACHTVTHSCLLFPDSTVHRVDSERGTIFYVTDVVHENEWAAERNYCLQMTAAFSKITEPTKFVCRECQFQKDCASCGSNNAFMYVFVVGLACFFIVFLICDILDPPTKQEECEEFCKKTD